VLDPVPGNNLSARLAAGRIDMDFNPYFLAGLDGPSANAEMHGDAGGHALRLTAGVGGQMPDSHGASPLRSGDDIGPMVRDRGPPSPHDGKPRTALFPRVAGADAAEVVPAAIPNISPDEGPQPVVLPDLVAVQVGPTCLPAPAVCWCQAAVDVEGN